MAEQKKRAEWEVGTCRVPMWSGYGMPAGFCDAKAFGPQLPDDYLRYHYPQFSGRQSRIPYCAGHCCPAHGGPREGEPIIFQDGRTEEGRPMWCAVMPGFQNLQESEAGFDGNPFQAVANLAKALKQAPQDS